MAAQIYGPPASIPLPQHDVFLSYDERLKLEAEWLDRLRAYSKKQNSGKYVGEIVTDFDTRYMVSSLDPLSLIHIPLNGTYQSPRASQWTSEDITDMIERRQSIEQFFSCSKSSNNPRTGKIFRVI